MTARARGREVEAVFCKCGCSWEGRYVQSGAAVIASHAEQCGPPITRAQWEQRHPLSPAKRRIVDLKEEFAALSKEHAALLAERDTLKAAIEEWAKWRDLLTYRDLAPEEWVARDKSIDALAALRQAVE